VLLGYGEALDGLLDVETVLHWDLRAKGHRLYLDSTVRTAHICFSRWGVFLRVQYLLGRTFAGSRMPHQARGKRWMYFAASPLIPLVRLARVSRGAMAAKLWSPWLRCLPALAIGLGMDGVGQAVGYLAGPGDAVERLGPYEFCRVRNVNERDQREVFGFP
jgi:hypothetical protein